MDRVVDLTQTVQQVVEDYAQGKTWRASAYAISDAARQIYTVNVIPDTPRKQPSAVVVMARVVGETVLIDEDITDRPLWEELVRAGIPRERIVLLYAGEQVEGSTA